jgi:glycosyltransferase involved in cell wall biosynthesis
MNKRKQVRVVHVLGSMDPGGLETWLLQVLKDIDRDRFQLYFCTCGPQPGLLANEVTRLGGVMVPCAKGKNLWSFSLRFRKILREGKYDVVHSHVHCFSGAVLRWAKTEGVSIRIAHSHNAHDGRPDSQARRCYRKLMKSWISRYATDGLAPSEAAAQLFGDNWRADNRFQILRFGLDLRPFRESIDGCQIRTQLGIPCGAPVIGHVGRFDQSKNHRFLLEIADSVLKCRPDIHFILVGDGQLRPEIEARVRTLGISSNIHFTGIRTDVPRIMRGAMDLFLFPSLKEGFGFSLLEAQAAGLHCLVSDTVPRDAACMPDSSEFLSLSAGSIHWAACAITKLEVARSKSATVLNDQFENEFSTQSSLRQLMNIYTSNSYLNRSTALERHA